MTKSERNRARLEEVRQKNCLLADLAKPLMRNGVDISLFTFRECEEIKKAQSQHDTIFMKRAVELKFYPEILNKKEKAAILRCMSYEELVPFYYIVAIKEKNGRLLVLSSMEQIELRKYARMTHQFADKSFDPELYSDKNIVEITENYFKIMRQNQETVYEEPYYFLSEKRHERVLRFLENFVSEKDGWVSTDNLVLDNNQRSSYWV